MTLSKLTFLGLPVLGLMVLVAPMSGTSVTGTANIGGGVTVTATSITFTPTFNTPSPASPFQTGSYAGLTGGVFNVTTLTGPPLTGAISRPDFMTFTTGLATPITFDLQEILAGNGTAANCTSGFGLCTPAGSPFTLIQSSTGVTVDLAFMGIAYTGTAASGSTPTLSLFTTQLLAQNCGQPAGQAATVQGCLAVIQGGGSISASYSATFGGTNVPEPSSLLLMAAGLIGAGSFARRKLSKP